MITLPAHFLLARLRVKSFQRAFPVHSGHISSLVAWSKGPSWKRCLPRHLAFHANRLLGETFTCKCHLNSPKARAAPKMNGLKLALICVREALPHITSQLHLAISQPLSTTEDRGMVWPGRQNEFPSGSWLGGSLNGLAKLLISSSYSGCQHSVYASMLLRCPFCSQYTGNTGMMQLVIINKWIRMTSYDHLLAVLHAHGNMDPSASPRWSGRAR